MVRTLTSLAFLLTAGFVTSASMAQETNERVDRLDSIRKASEWMKTDVVNPQGETLATVDDILFDSNGKIHYLVAGRGGVAGVGESHVAIPATKIKMGARGDDTVFVLNMTEEQFKDAPKVESSNYNEFKNANWMTSNNTFFGITEEGSTERPATFWQGSALLGADLDNRADEKMGNIHELLIDDRGHLAFAIISSGEILGLGGDHIAVPFDALMVSLTDVNENNPDLQVFLDTTADSLKKAPLVKEGEYDRLLDADYIQQVYKHFPRRTQ